MGDQREAGILLPIFSLPSRFGIGDLGPGARAFIDFLEQAGQSCWQFLPIHPTRPGGGFSPYDSPSAFAGNPMLISPDDLVEEGWLDPGDLPPVPEFSPERVDYPAVVRYKTRLLATAFTRFRSRKATPKFDEFCERHQAWLEDYALFSALGGERGENWRAWPESLRKRRPVDLDRVRERAGPALQSFRFEQFLFFQQWMRLKRKAGRRGIDLIGDLPIYVTLESADVWSRRGEFRLTEEGDPLFQSGVPPDYFSRNGQLWGNPVYHWPNMRRNGYVWWHHRIAHELSLVDRLRLDHFRGFVASWQVPAGAVTAVSGHWSRGPGRSLLEGLVNRFGAEAFIAEDLGTITLPVSRLRRELGLAGMSVLLFAFDSDDPRHPYLPENHERNSVAYTGTHDNAPVRAWFEEEAGHGGRSRIRRRLGRRVSAAEAGRAMVRMVLESRAATAVIPLQDYLGLGGEARINRPAGRTGNWRWRLGESALSPVLARGILRLTRESAR